MKRILLWLLLFCLPLAALADGMVIPTVAYPAKVTIPDQRALIQFSNGVERLVIETRFTGAGTNFAWVVPLPSPPVIEPATSGLFPTLQALFHPEIAHEVPKYFLGILAALIILLIIWNSSSPIRTIVFFFLLAFFAAMLLPALSGIKTRGVALSSSSNVSILDRKLVGIFDTTTISSRDPQALGSWLRENGFAFPTNAEPVIASYVNDGWVFVATKIRRDQAETQTSTPHPLSFTFKTAQAVYPLRLTGLTSPSLSVDLYCFGSARATAPHFQVESCWQPHTAHPLLRQWIGDGAVGTKLTATLSSADMRQDVWLIPSPFLAEEKLRLFSRHGALITALNWGASLFVAGLLVVYRLHFASAPRQHRWLRQLGIVFAVSLILVGLIYVSLPKVEVRLVKRGRMVESLIFQHEQQVLSYALADGGWQNILEARSKIQAFISDTNLSSQFFGRSYYGQPWENLWTGGQVHEEDSPGNYLLRETNHQLQIIIFKGDGAEAISGTYDLPPHP